VSLLNRIAAPQDDGFRGRAEESTTGAGPVRAATVPAFGKVTVRTILRVLVCTDRNKETR
jgi:hypothetical protein